MLFLNEAEREDRVLGAYKDAVPKDNPFAWDAAKGQLELFASVGFRADLVKQVAGDIHPNILPEEQTKPVHLVVMGGHRIDKDRATARFPPDKEPRAKALLREAIESQGNGTAGSAAVPC